MIKLNIKPLSVNQAWKGRRFKTNEYKKYEQDVLFLLPKIKMPNPPYVVYIQFSFSSLASDIDNPTKLLLDIFQKKYGINDKHIVKLILEKVHVKKGDECILFSIEEKK